MSGSVMRESHRPRDDTTETGKPEEIVIPYGE